MVETKVIYISSISIDDIEDIQVGEYLLGSPLDSEWSINHTQDGMIENYVAISDNHIISGVSAHNYERMEDEQCLLIINKITGETRTGYFVKFRKK